MIQSALIASIIYYIFYVLDFTVGWQTLTRPIVAAPIIGLALGDLQTGIVMGASLEAIYMGISAVGGSVPADAFSGTIIAVAFTILTGASVEEAIAISFPIATVMAMLNAIMMPVFAFAVPVFDKLSKEGNTSGYNRAHIGFLMLVMPLVNTVVMFLSIAFGIEKLQLLLAQLPPFIMAGITAASGMLPVIGFGILTSMIWSKETGMYLFVGFVLAKYLGLGPVPIAIIGTVIAVAGFFRDKQISDAKQLLSTTSNDEEDFF